MSDDGAAACSQCGERVPSGAPLCPNCGADQRPRTTAKSGTAGAIVGGILTGIVLGVFFAVVTTMVTIGAPHNCGMLVTVVALHIVALGFAIAAFVPAARRRLTATVDGSAGAWFTVSVAATVLLPFVPCDIYWTSGLFSNGCR